MPRPSVTIRSDLDNAVKGLQELREEVPQTASDASKMLGHQWIREAKRTMQRNGSVVTGTGINSFKTSTNKGTTSVLGAAYLEDLDKGTTAHYPDSDSYRFRAAARQYGMDRVQLAKTIARKGTRPHPWIREATNRLNKTAKNRLQVEIADDVSQASRKI